MIARTWRGTTDAEMAQDYADYLTRTGFLAFAETTGNRGAVGLRRIQGGRAEFVVISLWESRAAVTRFAGPQPDRAVFFPEDERFLVERDGHADHFDVVYADLQRPSVMRRLIRRWFATWRHVVRGVPANGWRLAAFR